MASKWTEIEREDAHAVPTMLAQAIIVGAALTVGAIACSGLYLAMIDNAVALLPWMTVMILVAVAFTYIVGFALLWCADAFTHRMGQKAKPFAFGAFGLIGYGLWGTLVATTLLNSISQPLNGALLSNGNIIAVIVSFVAFGFVAFFLAQTLAKALAVRPTLAYALLIVQVIFAIIGIIVAVMMFSAIYR